MNEVIGAVHEFHDEEFAAGWADRFVPTLERLELFDVMLAELTSRVPPSGCVVELGIGPGYLADHLLRAMSSVRYYGIDSSDPMLVIARQRLGSHSARVTYIQADLLAAHWWRDIRTPVDAIVSTWALHDLGCQESVEAVYARCARMLQDGGILLNGDFIKPDKTMYEYEPGRFEIARHLAILRRVGFTKADCLVVLEEETESPTAAQNYACFRAVVARTHQSPEPGRRKGCI